MGKFLTGFVLGNLCGIYIAQNYKVIIVNIISIFIPKVPEMKSYFSDLLKKLQDVEKEKRKEN